MVVQTTTLAYQRIRLIRHLATKLAPLRNLSTNVPSSSSAGSSSGEPTKHLNKGRFDWLFADGYRRPLAEDQGGKLRRDWVAFGYHPTDEHQDWKTHHFVCFVMFTLMFPCSVVFLWYAADWPDLFAWGHREAFMELERREKAGLPLISKDFIDPKIVATHLPSDEELGDFKIVI